MYEYVGAVHIHSVFSDGTGTIPEIATAASEVGLDFIMMSDHNTLKPRKDGLQGWHDNVLVIIGHEINDRDDRNHYLAFGLDDTVGTGHAARDYVRLVRERGGIGFLAHPDECRQSMPEHPPYPWTDWDVRDHHGIEIWNHMSEWAEGLTEENKFQRFIHPLKSIISPPAVTLRRWDEMNRERLVAAIGGVDAHAHKADVMGFFTVEVFPYKVMFKSIHTHVLLDAPLHANDPDFVRQDEAAILDALARGRSFVANSYNGDPRGFKFWAAAPDGIHQQGATLPFQHGAIQLNCQLPFPAEIRLVRNGATLLHSHGRDLSLTVDEPGIHRIEAWKGDAAWIFSNPIRITDSGE